jgi:hypothetical protein
MNRSERVNQLLFDDNFKWLRFVCQSEPVEIAAGRLSYDGKSLPNASVVELIEPSSK